MENIDQRLKYLLKTRQDMSVMFFLLESAMITNSICCSVCLPSLQAAKAAYCFWQNMYNYFHYICHSASREMIPSTISRRWCCPQPLDQITGEWAWKSVFSTQLSEGVEMGPPRTVVLLVLIHCLIGSLECEQPIESWFLPLNSILSSTAPSLSKRYCWYTWKWRNWV